MDEKKTIQNVLKGQSSEFSKLVNEYQGLIYTTCLRFVNYAVCAQDLTQEVFITAYQKLNSFKAQSKFSTWLYQIAVNTCLNHVRKYKKINENKVDLDTYQKDLTSSLSPEFEAINKEDIQIIHKALNNLPENQRTAFILRKYEELPQKEISEIMKISEGAVEQLVQRARKNLIKELSGYFKKN